jgi:hypothetical protein
MAWPKNLRPKGTPRSPGSGRPPGAPNKLTKEVKRGFIKAFENVEPEFESWLRLVANGGVVQRPNPDGTFTPVVVDPDPLGAVRAVVSMADFVFPRINKTAITNGEGGPVEFVIRDLGSESSGK